MAMLDREAAMVEWPEERQNRLNKIVRAERRLEDIPPDFLRKIEGTSAFAELVQAMLDGFLQKTAPTEKHSELSASIDQPNAFGDYEEIVRQFVLALGSVASLRQMPTREMWEYLWALAGHSTSLDTFLPQAVVVAAAEDNFRRQFFAIARDVVKEAAQNPGRRAIKSEKEVGAALRENWKKNPCLSDLWRGRFERSSYAIGRDDDHVLSIVAEIDAAEFVQLLAFYNYPDPVAHALMWCSPSWQFRHWKTVALIAPTAFGEDATWNGSLILPLLLSFAREKFQFGLGHELAPNQVSEATDDIKILAAEVAKVIAHRPDSIGCMTRWGNWLVQTAIPAVSANSIPHPIDAAAQGFIDAALFDALIVEMPADRWSSVPSPDAESWEPWCQLAAGALIALAGKALMPSTVEFLDEWSFSPDGWSAQRGRTLKLHAIPFLGAGLRVDGYGARLLAIPMVGAERADEKWKQFWDSTATLRELVEFGDPDESDNGGWQGRADAARLLMLQFSIGLMMLDHLCRPPSPLAYDLPSAISNTFPQLNEAVREMTAIDQLNGKFWSEAVRHLALRRAKWLSDPVVLNGTVLSAELRPTLADFIDDLAGDTENLLGLAYVAQRNGVDIAALAAAFSEAGINIGAEIVIAEQLLKISPRAISLNKEQLDIVRKVSQHTLHATFTKS